MSHKRLFRASYSAFLRYRTGFLESPSLDPAREAPATVVITPPRSVPIRFLRSWKLRTIKITDQQITSFRQVADVVQL